VTYAKSGLFWSQCFLPSLVIRKAQAGGGKSSLGLLCSVSSCSPYNANLKLDQSVFAVHDSPLYFEISVDDHSR
jgi:hypothetical protein